MHALQARFLRALDQMPGRLAFGFCKLQIPQYRRCRTPAMGRFPVDELSFGEGLGDFLLSTAVQDLFAWSMACRTGTM
jgi:hypothetical protein